MALYDEDRSDDHKNPVLDFHVHPVEVHEQRPSSRRMYEEIAPDVAARIEEFDDPSVLRKHLLARGVHEAVILGEMVPITSGMVTNERVVEHAARGNDAASGPHGGPWLHPFVSLNPFLHENLPAELDALRACGRVAGVKLTPPYQHFDPADARMYPLYARLEQLELPVMLHTGLSTFKGTRLKYADPLLLDDVAVDFPSLPIVLAHSGRGIWYEQAALMARMHENVYLELAGLPPRNLRRYFPQLDELAGRMIFGSDWPVVPDLAENVREVRRVFEEMADRVLYGTGRSLLKSSVP